MESIYKVALCLLCLCLVATVVFAGGVDPREMPQERSPRAKVTATPAETSNAVNKARRAVVSPVKEVQMKSPRPQTVARAGKDEWLLSSDGGQCEPLSAVKRFVKSIGTFKTPKEFARQMQQRGFQAFAMDVGDVRDQVVRVKVPDMELDLTFKKAGLCR